eukprot:gene10203-10273_t
MGVTFEEFNFNRQILNAIADAEVTPQATPAQTVDQQLYYVPNVKTKINLLKKLLDIEDDIKKLIIFCKTRTAAEDSGVAITFCNPAEEAYIRKVEKLIRQSIPVKPIPDDVFIEETPYEERQDQAREVDMQKRKDDPEFKGAFHEKKTMNQRKKFDAAKDKARGNFGPKGGKSNWIYGVKVSGAEFKHLNSPIGWIFLLFAVVVAKLYNFGGYYIFTELDDNNVPENIMWESTDAENKEALPVKSMMLALWDQNYKNTLRIDLWTKDMPVDEMKRFFYETLQTMGDSFLRATGETNIVEDLRDYCTWCPVLHPIIGNWDVYDGNKPYGVVILLVGVIGILATVLNQAKLTRLTAWISLGLVFAGFAVSVLLVLSVGILSYKSIHQLESDSNMVDHTQKVIKTSTNLLQLMIDAETGMRGFVATNNKTFLDPYNSALPAIHANSELLKTLIADNPVQVKRMDSLSTYVALQLDILKENIATRPVSGLDYMIQHTMLLNGKHNMDQIRDLVDQIKETENKLLAVRKQSSEKASSDALYIVVIGSIVFMVIIIRLFFYIQTTFEQQKRAEREIKLANDELEKVLTENREQNWLLTGTGMLNEKMQGQQSERELGNNILTELCTYANASAGTFYLYNEENELLELYASYAFNDLNAVKKTVKVAEGWLGQVAKDQKPALIKGKLNNKLELASSLIKVELTESFIVPFFFDKNLKGVIEIAFNHELTGQLQKYILSAADDIGVSVNTAQARTIMHDLLSQVQQQAEELEAQQEEMRVTNEELMSKTEMLQASEEELRVQQEELRTTNAELEEKASLLEEKNQAIEEARNAINQKNESVKVADILHDMEMLFTEVAHNKKIKYGINKTTGVPELVLTDKVRVEQVLKNLLSNAFKFTSEGGSIDINVSSDVSAETLSFAIKDTGIGIPLDKQKIIFEAFQQADGSTSRRYGGTGLGLSISRELVSLLGGKIELTSEPGIGSEFVLTIPLKADVSSAATEIYPTVEAFRPDKEFLAPASTIVKEKNREPLVIIVEDDKNFADILNDYSRDHGYKSIIVNEGTNAVEIIKENQPDAVILDIMLPGKDGWQILKELKKDTGTLHIPVHLMSAGEAAANRVHKEGAISFLKKPIDKEVLDKLFVDIMQQSGTRFKQILLIEDNKTQSQALNELMQSEGITVDQAFDGASAFRMLHENDYQCVILDLNLPDISGLDFLDKIKEIDRFKALPVIINTAMELDKTSVSRLMQYANAMVVKTTKSADRLIDEVNLFLNKVRESATNGIDSSMAGKLKTATQGKDVVKGKKVLIVDDDMRNIFALSSALQGYDMIVEIANDGKEAIDKLEAVKDIDIVLMDIMMPVMDGYEATKYIRQQNKWVKLPVIALTAKAMMDDREKCIAAGANDYITKPLIMENATTGLTTEEIRELIDLVKRVHGFDFSDYSKASLKRRIARVLMIKKISFYDLKHILLNDQPFFQDFLEEITVNVTEMFRDPSFYKAVNTQVYSLAILMDKAGLRDKSFIYGTDVNTSVLRDARKGIYSFRNVKTYIENYQMSGLSGSLTDHFTTMYDAAAIHSELKTNTLFSVHNLISDTVFNEFQMISCRNSVIIVMHRKRNFLSEVEKLFSRNARMLLKEVDEKEKIELNTIYIAPANYHTLIEKDRSFSLDASEALWYSKPSIDVTFESAADVYQDKCLAVLLSGANQDGALGLLRLRNAGSLTIAQHPDDAEMPEMPTAAVNIDAVDCLMTTEDLFNLFRI